MPLMLPKQFGLSRQANYSGQPATTWGTVVTSDSVAHQFPSTYTELIASTDFESYWVNVWLHNNNGSNTDTDSLLSIYAGADTAEQEIITHLTAGWTNINTGTASPKIYGFPLRIPAGTRLSARHRSVRTSTGVTCMIELLGGGAPPHWTGTKVECVGANTATSSGTFLTPGTTSDGTLTSIGTNTYNWGFTQVMRGGNIDTTLTGGLLSVDYGSGASTVLPGLAGFLFAGDAAEVCSSRDLGGRFCSVPAGTTLYLRGRFSGVAEAADFCIYGVA